MFFTALKINNRVPALTATARLFCRPVAVLHNKSLKTKNKYLYTTMDRI